MLKIRLTRRGKKHHPTYRVVVAEAEWPRDGKFLEDLGYYNPMIEPLEIKIDLEKVDEWLAKGAQPTKKVASLISIARDPSRLEKLSKKKEKKAKKKAADKRKVKDSKEKSE
jgi:small subunit ribosomal protein S16